MKIRVHKTSYFFKIDRYPVRFGIKHTDGREDTINKGEIICIRILGIEIEFCLISKKDERR